MKKTLTPNNEKTEKNYRLFQSLCLFHYPLGYVGDGNICDFQELPTEAPTTTTTTETITTTTTTTTPKISKAEPHKGHTHHNPHWAHNHVQGGR